MIKGYKETNCKPSIYASFYPELRNIAIEHGYSLTIHGSLMRDYDLIATPWIEDAKPTFELIKAIRDFVGGKVRDESGTYTPDVTKMKVNPKPHNRRGYSIYLTGRYGEYLDISVCPNIP